LSVRLALGVDIMDCCRASRFQQTPLPGRPLALNDILGTITVSAVEDELDHLVESVVKLLVAPDPLLGALAALQGCQHIEQVILQQPVVVSLSLGFVV